MNKYQYEITIEAKTETEADAINNYRRLEHESGNNWDDVIPVIKT